MSVFSSMLISDLTISRRRRTPNGQGGWQIDYVDIGTVRGRIRPATSREREEAALQQRDITHVLYVLAGDDVVRGDRVSLNDFVVEVEGIREPSRAGHHLEIDCVEHAFERTLPEMEEGS